MAARLTIGFLGAGKMATALAGGFIRAGLTTPKQLLASDVSDSARKAFVKGTGAKATDSNAEVVRFAQVLILAVKPDQVSAVLAGVRDGVTNKHLVISIAAGVPISVLESALAPDTRVIRVMPNTPALVAQSATGF